MNENKLSKVEPIRKYEQVLDQLRHKILLREYQVGEKLPTVAAFCREFGTSQATVREALRILEAEGLIESRQGSGTYAVKKSLGKVTISSYLEGMLENEQQIRQIPQVRGALEGLACALCAQNAVQKDLDEIQANLDQQEAIVAEIKAKLDGSEKDSQELIDRLDQLASEFHFLISKASRNDLADEIIRQVLLFIYESGAPYLYACHRPSESLQEHRQIFDYIRSGKADLAEKAMKKHIQHGYKFLPKKESAG